MGRISCHSSDICLRKFDAYLPNVGIVLTFSRELFPRGNARDMDNNKRAREYVTFFLECDYSRLLNMFEVSLVSRRMRNRRPTMLN